MQNVLFLFQNKFFPNSVSKHYFYAFITLQEKYITLKLSFTFCSLGLLFSFWSCFASKHGRQSPSLRHLSTFCRKGLSYLKKKSKWTMRREKCTISISHGKYQESSFMYIFSFCLCYEAYSLRKVTSWITKVPIIALLGISPYFLLTFFYLNFTYIFFSNGKHLSHS